MKKNIVCMALLIAAGVTPSFARTLYVSFNGADVIPCSRTAPCKTITFALSAVPADGTVDVIGSGMYDSFTITKSVTVEAEPGVVAAFEVASSGTGATVDAGPNDVVILRNLHFHGLNGTGIGIQIKTGGLITVEDCVTQNLFHGLDYTASTSGNLSVKGGSYEASDTSIFLCCASGARYTAVIDRVRISGARVMGINADGAAITVSNSVLSGSGTSGPGLNAGINVAHGMTVMENDVISSYAEGVTVFDTGFISSCTITDNATGVVAGGNAFSRGNNTIVGNGTNVNGTLKLFPAL
jgi:hypothetical protein